ncbi:hypothetical protein Pan97_06900 [Bremerella volcania]|uniref:Uncharacterized protein n=1 Tax=Bremerella volcania TaxID=2527984 RepID=A0A518C388_9BACT|nr:hypothetical protein Pan97_06900 [Bremerella volcania]
MAGLRQRRRNLSGPDPFAKTVRNAVPSNGYLLPMTFLAVMRTTQLPPRARDSGKYLVDYLTTFWSGQAVFSSFVKERQAVVLKPKGMQNSRMQIAKMNFPFHRA